MKTLVLSIAVGDLHQRFHDVSRESQMSYADRIGADYHVIMEQEISKTTPHWEKFQISTLLDTYDRIIYLDADVIVRSDCPSLFDVVPADHFGAFNEAPFTNRSREMMIEACREYGVTLRGWNGLYFNSGVMVISRCHRDMFVKPEIENCHFYEQTYLNIAFANSEYKFFDLPYHYNRMSCMDGITGEERHVAYILHYAGFPDVNQVIGAAARDLEIWKSWNFTNKRHVVVIVGGGLGDQVCAEPIIRYMKKHIYPNDDVTVTTHWTRLFRHLDMPVFENGKFQGENHLNYRMLFTLPEPDTREGELVWKVATHLMCHPVDFMSIAAMRRTLPIADRQYKLDVSVADVENLEKRFGRLDDLVLVHAGAHWETKTFPLEYWQAIVDGLALKGHRVCLIGKTGGDNLEHRGFVPVLCPENGVDMRDQLSLGELIAVISKARVVLSNDSAPIHIAGAFDNEIVLIPTCKHPDHILPWRNGSIFYKAKALYKALTIDDMPSAPTEIYEILGDKLVDSWSKYLPDVEDVINAI